MNVFIPAPNSEEVGKSTATGLAHHACTDPERQKTTGDASRGERPLEIEGADVFTVRYVYTFIPATADFCDKHATHPPEGPEKLYLRCAILRSIGLLRTRNGAPEHMLPQEDRTDSRLECRWTARVSCRSYSVDALLGPSWWNQCVRTSRMVVPYCEHR